MDALIEQPAGSKAAAASSRAKRAILIVCALLAAASYVSEEKHRAQANADGQGMYREVHDLMAHFAIRFDDAASVSVGKLFYEKQSRVYCGEVNRRNGRGAEVKLKDGVRIFVCGPSMRERQTGE
ncbi:MAG: hypothetical protein ACJ8LG_00240 [Massilia sp.]